MKDNAYKIIYCISKSQIKDIKIMAEAKLGRQCYETTSKVKE